MIKRLAIVLTIILVITGTAYHIHSNPWDYEDGYSRSSGWYEISWKEAILEAIGYDILIAFCIVVLVILVGWIIQGKEFFQK